MKELNINGEIYVLKSDIPQLPAEKFEDMEYCIVRTYSAGVFAGYVESKEGKNVVIRKVRRIWYWAGANSLSQLAVSGTCKPNECKFAVEVDKIEVTEAIEIIPCTEESKKSIMGVKKWEMK